MPLDWHQLVKLLVEYLVTLQVTPISEPVKVCESNIY
jgi:hypothetical protein